MSFASRDARDTPGRYGAWWLAAAGTVLPAALFLDDNLAYNLFYLLCAIGCWRAVAFWRSGALLTEEGALALAGAAVPLTALLSFWVNGADPRAWSHIQEAQLPMAGILLVALVFRRHASVSTFWFIVVCSGAAIGALAINDLIQVADRLGWDRLLGGIGSGRRRVAASNNAVIFGGVALVFSACCALALRYVGRKSPGATLLTVAALLVCVFALYLSGTRGAWIAIPAIAIAVLLALRGRAGRLAYGTVAVVVVVLSLAYLHPGVQKRVQRAVQEYSDYRQLPADQPVSGSVGMRLEGWHLAWQLAKAHPLWGAGPGLWTEGLTDLEAAGVATIRIDLDRFPHPHNEYLSALALRGVLGLAAELILLGLLFRAFWRRAVHPDSQVQLLALAGIAVVVGVAVIGMTAVPLGWWRINSIMYAFLFAAAYGSMRRAEEVWEQSKMAARTGVEA